MNPVAGFLWFIAIAGVLFAIWVWADGNLGYWAIPIVLAVTLIPAIVTKSLKTKRDRN
jgi:hypothetical protein